VTRLPLGTRAAAALVILLGWPSGAAADSIQKAGLTTGIAEGFGRTPGVYIATIFDVGFRSTDPSVTKQAVMIPAFVNWSTPWDIGKTHISFKAVPFVAVTAHAPGFGTTRPYSPYGSVWFSWFLGSGWNLSVGEGAQFGFSNKLTSALGRDYVAFQQNVALSYVRNNWNVTANTFYTAGRTRDTGSQPNTFNTDFTAIKRNARKEYGVIGYGVWDLNLPSVGYASGKQSEVAVGGYWGYLIGNLITLNGRLTTDIYQKNFGGHDTRLSFLAVLPLWTPSAPKPRNAK
jgi:hypothetical protein